MSSLNKLCRRLTLEDFDLVGMYMSTTEDGVSMAISVRRLNAVARLLEVMSPVSFFKLTKKKNDFVIKC